MLPLLECQFHLLPSHKIPFSIYRINKDDNEKVSISVKITAKAKDADTDPIMTKCWIETGTQQINSEADLKLSVVAEVRQVIRMNL